MTKVVRHAPAGGRASAVALLFALAITGRAFAQPDTTPAKDVQRTAQPLGFDHLGYAEGLPQANVQAMVQDGLGFMWLGTQDGLARYDGRKMRVFRPGESETSISTGYITALVLDATGKIWVGTDNKGVNLYDPGTDRFTRFAHGSAAGSLTSEGVNAIVRDRKDRVWFAMSGGGLNRFDPAKANFVEYATTPLDVTITAIDDDGAGNLWLGTADAEVIRWNPDSGASVKYQATQAGVAINAILSATNGKVWIGTEGDGLVMLDPSNGKLVRYRHDSANPDSLTDGHVSALFEDRNQAIWIGTRNGVNRIDPSGELVQYRHERDDPASLIYPWITSIYQDRGGVMWIGGKAGGVCKFSPLRPKFGHHRMRTDTATSFFDDPDGTLWVGTYHGGLYRYEHTAKRVTTYHGLGRDNSLQLDAAWISALHRDRHGTLWIATLELGLIAFDPATDTYRQYHADSTDDPSLPTDAVWDIWEDPDGGLWLATWGAGLVRFDPRTGKFTSVTVASAVGLSSDHLYRLYPDPKEPKTLWIGTAKGGLVRFDIAKGTATSFRHRAEDSASLTSDDVLSIYREPTGTVWVGTYGGGLNRLDPATGRAQRFTTSNSDLTSDVVLGILPDEKGALWLSTNGGGLVQFDPKAAKFFAYEPPDGVQDNEFTQGSFARNKAGKLFFGGVNGFNAFFPRDITRDTYVPPIVMTGLKVFNQEMKLDRPIWMLPSLELSYSDSFELQFAALSFASPNKNRYAYKLEGFDDTFIETDRPYATYTKLVGGSYTLRVRASNEHGAWNETGISLKVFVTPPWWRTWRAFGVYVLLLSAAVYTGFRLQRLKVLRIEREARLAADQEARAREIKSLNIELRRQIGERSRDLLDALASSLHPSTKSTELVEGDVVDGRYKVVGTLGRGGMGVVYEVERKSDRRHFALKSMTGYSDAKAAAQFAHEAELVASVQHDNLVAIVDVGFGNGFLFLVLELMIGGSLESCRERFGDAGWAKPLLRDVAAGLEALHARGVVHRDLKPANVLLYGEGQTTQAKIADFGISRREEDSVLEPIPPPEQTSLAGLTRTGALIGTPMYMAPELSNISRAARAPCDVFSYGVLAYEMLTRKYPFAAPPISAALAGLPVAPPTPTRVANPGIDAKTAALVDACLHLDPNMRPTAGELVDAFGGERAAATITLLGRLEM